MAGVSPEPREGTQEGWSHYGAASYVFLLEHSKVVCVKLYKKVAMTEVGFQSQAANTHEVFLLLLQEIHISVEFRPLPDSTPGTKTDQLSR